MNTQIPTKKDYEEAVNELKKLNDELFYDDFKMKIKTLESQMQDLSKSMAENNQNLIDEAIQAVSSVSNHINEFVQMLSVADEKNKEFLEQNRAYVTLTKKQITETEEKLTVIGETLQQMDERWEELFHSYEKKYQIHEQALKNLLVVREEALINKVTQLHENWSLQQYNHDEAHKAEILQWHECVAAQIKAQNKQNEKMLENIKNNLSSKADLAKVEKKQALKTNILLAVVAIEAILLGLQFFI